MWMVWLAPAMAGSLMVTLDVAGQRSTVELADMAACESTSFKVGTFPDMLEVSARVEPQEENTLLVAMELAHRRNELRTELKPTLRLQDGKKGEVKVVAEDRVVSVVVVAKGFAGEVCPTTRSTRTTRSESHHD